LIFITPPHDIYSPTFGFALNVAFSSFYCFSLRYLLSNFYLSFSTSSFTIFIIPYAKFLFQFWYFLQNVLFQYLIIPNEKIATQLLCSALISLFYPSCDAIYNIYHQALIFYHNLTISPLVTQCPQDHPSSFCFLLKSFQLTFLLILLWNFPSNFDSITKIYYPYLLLAFLKDWLPNFYNLSQLCHFSTPIILPARFSSQFWYSWLKYSTLIFVGPLSDTRSPILMFWINSTSSLIFLFSS